MYLYFKSKWAPQISPSFNVNFKKELTDGTEQALDRKPVPTMQCGATGKGHRFTTNVTENSVCGDNLKRKRFLIS